MVLNGTQYMTAVVVRLTLEWLERGVNPIAEPNPAGGYRLRFGPRYRVAATACFLPYPFFHLLGVVAYLKDPDVTWTFLIAYEAIFLVFSLMASIWLLEAYRRSVRIDDEGLEIRRPILGRLRIAWEEIEAVTYSETFRVLKVRRRGGRACRLSTGLDGLGTLRAFLAIKAPHAADKAARFAMPRPIPPPGLIAGRHRVRAIPSGPTWRRRSG